MFSQLEHEALMRLMTHATGYVPDSRRIAHWLQEWEQTGNPRGIKAKVPGLAPFPPGREGRGDGWRARNAPSLPLGGVSENGK